MQAYKNQLIPICKREVKIYYQSHKYRLVDGKKREDLGTSVVKACSHSTSLICPLKPVEIVD